MEHGSMPSWENMSNKSNNSPKKGSAWLALILPPPIVGSATIFSKHKTSS